jgi:LacI family transcriptional regulator
VSNVINGVPTVSKSNLERVNAAMLELDFVPNAHARLLRGSERGAIGLLVLNIANPHFAAVAEEAETVAERVGSSILIASSGQDLGRENRYLTMFEQTRVRGLIVAPVSGVTPQIAQTRGRGTPVIIMDEVADSHDFCTVTLDGGMGGFLAGEHLVRVGRRRIAVVGGPLSQIADRVSGAGRAVAQELPGASVSLMEVNDLTVAEGRRIAASIADLAPADRPDGIFAANDVLALGILIGLENAGVQVPRDIAVIGFDDSEFASIGHLPLTTIAQPRASLASEATRLLLSEEEANASGEGHQHERVQLQPTLVVRETTAPR